MPEAKQQELPDKTTTIKKINGVAFEIRSKVLPDGHTMIIATKQPPDKK